MIIMVGGGRRSFRVRIGHSAGIRPWSCGHCRGEGCGADRGGMPDYTGKSMASRSGPVGDAWHEAIQFSAAMTAASEWGGFSRTAERSASRRGPRFGQKRPMPRSSTPRAGAAD